MSPELDSLLSDRGAQLCEKRYLGGEFLPYGRGVVESWPTRQVHEDLPLGPCFERRPAGAMQPLREPGVVHVSPFPLAESSRGENVLRLVRRSAVEDLGHREQEVPRQSGHNVECSLVWVTAGQEYGFRVTLPCR